MEGNRYGRFAKVLVLYAMLSVLIMAVQGTITNFDDEKCVIDEKLPNDSPGNYLDCNTTEAIESNRTTCCQQNGEKICCDGAKKAGKMIWIGSTIAGCTVILMTGCFIAFWCEAKYVPCLKPCIDSCQAKCKCCPGHKKLDEEDEELSDIAEQMWLKNKEYVKGGYEYAPADNSLAIPDGLRGRPDDSWWDIMPDGHTSYA